jgi:HK97 family phage portal protein
MAWNSNKSLGNYDQKVALNAGAPVAFNPSFAGKPYSDSWDIERAYREGMQKVTWVFRCIDAISGNQARLPMILKEDNSPQGNIVTRNRGNILDILNSKSNQGENSFIFRYRLSAQLLMSSRGAFVEKVLGRDGKIIALHLLPPQHTRPIPDPKKFVSGYEVDMRNGTKEYLKPEQVMWIRRPHPLDPYLSITPMESAGVAIEIENLAKLYNRNYLLNDGRPGGLLVVRGEIDDDDKDELRNRFRGNLGKTGATTVISADDGVDFVDTSASPRDAAYTQMRQITKEEILSAFGVPESAIGNAAGRTFSNAGEELRVFWMETMLPHLDSLARAFDELDDRYYVDFDTSSVPILIIAKQERQRYLMDEFQQGLISVNEYRDGTGKKKVESELADSLLQNPNQTPIANTEKPFKPEEQQPVDMAAGAAAPAGPPGLPMTSPEVPPEELAAAGIPATPEVAAPVSPETGAAPVPEGALSADFGGIEYKSAEISFDDEWGIKAEQDSDRWTEILDRALERYYERQQRVISEKSSGAKSRKAITAKNLDIESIFDSEVWAKQLNEDIRPMLKAIITDAVALAAQKTNMPAEVEESEVDKIVDEQVKRMEKANNTTKEEIAAALIIAMAMGDDEDRIGLLKAALAAIFANLLGKRKRVIAEQEAQASYNAGTYLSGIQMGGGMKTWVTRRDSRVRGEHILLHGKTVEMKDGFLVDGSTLRFPGDPLAPISLTINCRCRLRFD